VWQDLQANRAFLDVRTGNDWDLFFAGLSAFKASDRDAIAIDPSRRKRDFPAYHNPHAFTSIERWVTGGHRAALAADRSEKEPWSYQGGTDVLSFMTYGRDPDWLSLKAAPLYTAEGEPLRLVHVAEGLAQWKTDNVDSHLAPGEALGSVNIQTGWLTAALGWTATAAAGGVLGNAAYELVRKLL
jgi:hypothetical protein